MKTFGYYLNLREGSSEGGTSGGGDNEKAAKDAKGLITSKIKLQKKEGSSDFAPFTVDKTNHPNLRLLIKAFADSDKVGLGYTTLDKTKGEHEPQLKKKTLHLTGGAVRDHLRGKTPRNYDLVTDATTSEIRMVLTQSEHGFTEVQPRDERMAGDERYARLPAAGTKNKIFYASRWDKTGKEIEMTVEINGEKFELATLSRHSKSRRIQPDKAESATSVEEDSMNRDFTINAMYIPLAQSDGDNSDLVDPHGGAHHLKNGEVHAVGSLADKLKADPSTALRYVKMVGRYGNPDKIPDKYKATIERFKDMADVDKGHVRKEFISGLEHPDIDPRKYLGAYKQLGLLGTIFPNVEFDNEDMPPDFKGDRWLAPAWILRNNEPEEVQKMLEGGGWSKQEAGDIAYLVHLAHWANKKGFDADAMYDLKQKPHGLTKNKIREWMQMIGKHTEEVDAFLNHDDKDLGKMVDKDGRKQINPEYIKHLGRMPKPHELEGVKRTLSKNRWSDMLNKLKPRDKKAEDVPQDAPKDDTPKEEWVAVLQ